MALHLTVMKQSREATHLQAKIVLLEAETLSLSQLARLVALVSATASDRNELCVKRHVLHNRAGNEYVES